MQVRSSGSALIDAAGGKGNLGDTLNEQFNPFNQKNLDKASGGKDGVGIKVSFGSYKNSDKWTQSTHSEVLAGGNLTLVTQNKGDINVSDGTVLTNKGDPFASLDDSFVNSFAEDSALRNMFTAGDQHNDGAITLNAAGTLNIAALQDTHSSESSSFGASVTFTGGAITGAGINASESSSNGTTHTNARITSEGALNLISGGDTNITGGVLSGDTVNYDIGGDLNITSVQDHENSENSGFGLDVSTNGISGSFNSCDSDRDVVNEQSGITAQNGTSGSIGGDVNLEGSYLVDESGTGTLTVDGTVNSTDIDNTANVSSTSISGGMNFGGPTDTPKDPAKGPSKPASNLNLPSHKENDTNSTTYSVLSGITVTDGQGNTVTTDHIRDTLDGANETLKDPAEEDLNALEIFAQTIASETLSEWGSEQIGDLFADGELNSLEHKLAHGLLGCVAGSMGGAECGSSALGAVAGEVSAELLHNAGMSDANVIQLAGLIGAGAGYAVGGDANMAGRLGSNAAEHNYLKHEEVMEMKNELSACQSKVCIDAVEAKYAALSKKNDQDLLAECAAGVSAACNNMLLASTRYINESSKELYSGLPEDVIRMMPDYLLSNDNVSSSQTVAQAIFDNPAMDANDFALAFPGVEDRQHLFGSLDTWANSQGHEVEWFSAAEGFSGGFSFVNLRPKDGRGVWSDSKLDLTDWLAKDNHEWLQEAGYSILSGIHGPVSELYDQDTKVDGDLATAWDREMLTAEQIRLQPRFMRRLGLGHLTMIRALLS